MDNKNTFPRAYAAYNKDIDIRNVSTSGGVFSIFASYFIKSGGCVFGAAFDDKFNVVHIEIDKIEDIGKLRGSKYPQSSMGSIFISVKKKLEENKLVLFSGTPCQIEGLKLFLYNTNQEKLFCMDFVCHGVASKLLWREYVNELNKSGKIENIVFKSKLKGWKKWYFKVQYRGGEVYQIRGSMNMFMRSYLEYCNIRPSCYECKFKGLKRVADFTISDCWGIAEKNKMINDNKGLSAVIIQNERAMDIFEKVKDYMVSIEYDPMILMNGNWTMFKSVVKNPVRTKFFESINDVGVIDSLTYFFRPSYKKWIKYYIYRFIGKEK